MSSVIPSAETRHRWWRKWSLWIVAVGVVALVSAGGYVVWAAHYAATAQQQSTQRGVANHTLLVELKKADAEIASLLKQHSSSFAEQEAYDADVKALAIWLVEAQQVLHECATATSVSACPALPAPPAIAGLESS